MNEKADDFRKVIRSVGSEEGTTKNAKSAKMEERIVNQPLSRASRIS